MKKIFAKAAWLRYIDNKEDYYKELSLEAQDVPVNRQQSPVQSVDLEVNAKVVPDVDKSRAEVVPKDEEDRDFDGAVGLEEVERAGLK